MHEIILKQNFLDEKSSFTLLQKLSSLPFKNERIFMFGKWITVPRKVLWIADKGISYKYSNIDHEPFPWPRFLQNIRESVTQECHTPFNGLLLNYYENGRDYMGWHSDDEPELGPNPTICSLSLGASRRFLLRNKKDRTKKEYLLHNGSLLIMKGECQKNWQHALPKMLALPSLRINLTFRHILS